MKSIIAGMLLAGAVFGATCADAAEIFTPMATANGSILGLRSAALQAGKVRVIVEIKGNQVMTGDSLSADAANAAAFQATAAGVLSSVMGSAPDATYLDFISMVAVDASADQIQALAGDSRVAAIYPDMQFKPFLIQSVPLINMPAAYAKGATGAGRAVAVLDTGVDKTHEFLRNKVISEACYSTTSAANGTKSLCPGGVHQSVKAGSGLDCPTSIEGCGHGSHVAGIAAGFNTSRSAGEPPYGVAKSASVVAIKVFSQLKRANCGAGATSDCATAFNSDIIAALGRVYALRGGVKNRKIDSVNMSLGGAAFTTGFCDTQSSTAPTKAAIDKLRRVGIATVIAAGNEGWLNAVSPPGCISTAISVSASTKKAAGKPEHVASYSNIGTASDMLAPGGDFSYPLNNGTDPILSSTGGTYKYFSGTSMAAPHVAGAIAAIRSRKACRGKTVAQIENAFKTSGPIITDQRTTSSGTGPHFKKHRLDVAAVMKKLGC